MNGIVFITTPGAAKRDFAHTLHEQTGKVDLVIIQKPQSKSLWKRIKGFIQKVGIFGIPQELFFLARLTFSKKHKHALELLKLHTPRPHKTSNYLPKTMGVSSPNTEEVRQILVELKPKVIAIWGGTIIKPEILETAPVAVNIHTGWCPYYRGAGGNQNAILAGDIEHLGITIHKAIANVDAGDIFNVIHAAPHKKPSELFTDLNDQAEKAYLDIITKLLNGETLPTTPQDTTLGKNYRLRDWTYEKQFKLADKLLCWEGESNLPAGRQAPVL